MKHTKDHANNSKQRPITKSPAKVSGMYGLEKAKTMPCGEKACAETSKTGTMK